MSIIDDALKKAREERDKNLEDKKQDVSSEQTRPEPIKQGVEPSKAETAKSEDLKKPEEVKLEPLKEVKQKIDIEALKKKIKEKPALFIGGGIMCAGILLLLITLIKTFGSPPSTPRIMPPAREASLPVVTETVKTAPVTVTRS